MDSSPLFTLACDDATLPCSAADFMWFSSCGGLWLPQYLARIHNNVMYVLYVNHLMNMYCMAGISCIYVPYMNHLYFLST
jgi:hypothetical protein